MSTIEVHASLNMRHNGNTGDLYDIRESKKTFVNIKVTLVFLFLKKLFSNYTQIFLRILYNTISIWE